MSDEIEILNEGIFLNKILEDRFYGKNQNLLMAYIGKTGSGKSWGCLRGMENWYKYKFNSDVPKENICFNPESVMNRIVNGKLPKGTILTMEEAGISMSSLDFQAKIAKLFNYIIQSFRNLNIGLFVNLPYLSMLNKTTRILLHYTMKTQEIKNNNCYFKIHQLQVNQETGKVYRHAPRFNIDGVMEKIDQIRLGKPSKDLIDYYEAEKSKFVTGLGKEVLAGIKAQGSQFQFRRPLTFRQQEILALHKQRLKQEEIAEKLGITQGAVSGTLKLIERKGYFNEIEAFS